MSKDNSNDCIHYLAMLGHEFRTPLNVISSTAQIVSRSQELGKLDSEKLNEYMDSIRKYCNRLTLLTNNIMDVASSDNSILNLACENLDVEDFINTLINNTELYQTKYKVKINLKVNLKFKYMICDFIKLERILLNLITNAIKYNNKKTKTITLSVYDNADDFVIFCIKDNGLGIPKEMLATITDKFVRVGDFSTRNTEGCGLGLAIVDLFVKALNGTLTINSEVGKGSEFIVSLPRYQKTPCVANEPRGIYQPLMSSIDVEFSNI